MNTTNRRHLVVLPMYAALLACVGLIACGGAQQAGVGSRSVAYESRCVAAHSKHRSAVKSRNYQPVRLIVERWGGEGAVTAVGGPARTRVTVLPEEAFVAAIAKGTQRSTLVTGRAGVGKSTFANSVESQLCGEMPVIMVDLAWDVTLTGEAGANPVLQAIAAKVGLPTEGDVLATLRADADGRPLLVLLDSFDEVPQTRRTEVAGHVRAAIDTLKEASFVLFARPPLFSASYKALGRFEAQLELPSVTCDQVDWFTTMRIATPWEKKNYTEFVARTRLARKTAGPMGCEYVQMSTWRDLDSVWQLAQPFGDKQTGGDFEVQYRGTRYDIYYFLAQALIGRDAGLDRFGYGILAAIDVVDRMVAAQAEDVLGDLIAFSPADCEKAAAVVHPADAPRALKAACEALLGSPLFKHSRNGWHFTSRTFEELFLARRLAVELDVATDTSCKLIGGRMRTLESSEVATFLIGHPTANVCLAEITRQLCAGNSAPMQIAGIVRRGLPGTAARVTVVGEALEKLKEVHDGTECATSVLQQVDAEKLGSMGMDL